MTSNLVWIVPLALLVGMVLGGLGGGGAILTVPILVYLLHQEPSHATAGSLIIVGLASAIGLFAHRAAGNVRFEDGIVFGLTGIAGSFVGSKLSAVVEPAVLMTAFGLLMLLVAGLMLRKRAADRQCPDCERNADRKGLPVLLVTATGVGFLTGFFGVGGGFAVVPALVLALGYSMPVAVGTSLVVIVVNSLTALAARAASGLDIDWPLILVFGAVAAAGSLLGGRLAGKIDQRHLSLAFTILLFLVSAYVLAINVPALLA
ncbi:MAG: sulfite exporter TauE/SafE family protein [Dermatophilus congolensis]|nr:sulfite exporter TauE/SafE family protein [Dermatophilus congolensis]